ncbi:PadR family transcriptional regulator [Anaeromicropila populeti]|nr:PadR family transcriptional regulator [Anaeromicropila populeti]
MENNCKIEEWKTQLKRGTLEYCILLLVNKRDWYGYEILMELNKWSCITTKESTIYPLLRRMLKDEYLDSFWQDTVQGVPSRKYYSITQKGKDYLALMTLEWEDLVQLIKSLKGDNT